MTRVSSDTACPTPRRAVLRHGGVNRSDTIDRKTRLRIAAHLRKKMNQLKASRARAAELMDLDPSVVSRMLTAERIGFDAALRMHRGLHIDMTEMVDIDPDPEWFEEGAERKWERTEPWPPPFRGASRSPQPGKQRTGGRS